MKTTKYDCVLDYAQQNSLSQHDASQWISSMFEIFHALENNLAIRLVIVTPEAKYIDHDYVSRAILFSILMLCNLVDQDGDHYRWVYNEPYSMDLWTISILQRDGARTSRVERHILIKFSETPMTCDNEYTINLHHNEHAGSLHDVIQNVRTSLYDNLFESLFKV